MFAFTVGFLTGTAVTYACYLWYKWSIRQLKKAERRGVRKAMKRMNCL